MHDVVSTLSQEQAGSWGPHCPLAKAVPAAESGVSVHPRRTPSFKEIDDVGIAIPSCTSTPSWGQGGGVLGLVLANGKHCVAFEQSLLQATVPPPAPSLCSSTMMPLEAHVENDVSSKMQTSHPPAEGCGLRACGPQSRKTAPRNHTS